MHAVSNKRNFNAGLFIAVSFLIFIGFALAQSPVKPNPGHSWDEIGGGTVNEVPLENKTQAPIITTNKLYNIGGILYWNGSVIGSGGGGAGNLLSVLQTGADASTFTGAPVKIGSDQWISLNADNYANQLSISPTKTTMCTKVGAVIHCGDFIIDNDDAVPKLKISINQETPSLEVGEDYVEVTGRICVNGGCIDEWPTGGGSGGGDITGVIAGTGLSGGGTSATVTLSANTSYLQRRVSGTCAAGSSIRVINADGTVTCETDDGGSGGGIDGQGTTNTIPLWTASGTIGNSLITQTGGTPPAEGDNLILNNGFESQLTNWTRTETPSTGNIQAEVNAPGHSGTRELEIEKEATGANGSATVTQQISVAAGTYTFSGWVNTEISAGDEIEDIICEVIIHTGNPNAPIYKKDINPWIDFEYNQFSRSVTLPSGTATILIRNTASLVNQLAGTKCMVDDLSLTQASAPTSGGVTVNGSPRATQLCLDSGNPRCISNWPTGSGATPTLLEVLGANPNASTFVLAGSGPASGVRIGKYSIASDALFIPKNIDMGQQLLFNNKNGTTPVYIGDILTTPAQGENPNTIEIRTADPGKVIIQDQLCLGNGNDCKSAWPQNTPSLSIYSCYFTSDGPGEIAYGSSTGLPCTFTYSNSADRIVMKCNSTTDIAIAGGVQCEQEGIANGVVEDSGRSSNQSWWIANCKQDMVNASLTCLSQ